MDKNTRKVFVVDDDEMLSMALEDYLARKTDCEISLFSTGEDCLQHLDEQPDIIILDYNLNSVHKEAANGLIILETIKKLNGSIKVIMLSSQEASWIILETIKKGAEEYVIKDENAFEKIATICDTSSS